MADGVEPQARAPSGRRRQQDRDKGTGLSVAELLARHAAGGPGEDRPTPRMTAPHRAPPSPEDTDQLILGGDPVGEASTDQYRLGALPRADGIALRTREIDESLVRLTAIHAGLGADVTARVSESSRLPAVRPPAGEPPPGAALVDDDGAPRPPPSRWTRAAKAVLVTLVTLLFVTTGVGWGAKTWLNAQLRQVGALDPGSGEIVDRAGQYGDENYLLVGSDTRADADPADGAGTAEEVPGARSDTVMVAHIPAKRDRVVVVSLPRDLQVDRPGCDRWDPVSQTYPGGTAPAQRNVKLNTAFEIGGPRCVTKVVQRLTGLAINHFTAIDFAGFKQMVDAVSGVPICVDRPVVDSVLGRVVPTAGPTVLAGDQALAFVRARHVRGDPTSDYGRIQRQQRFLSALIRKALSDQVLLNPAKMRAFVTAFASHTLNDNAGLDQLTSLGGSLRNLPPGKVTFITVPTQGQPDQDGNELLRKADTAALFTAIRSDQPLPGEAISPGGPVSASSNEATSPGGPVSASDTVPPGEVSLAVRNGSSRPGLAGGVADNLSSVGFTITRVGDAEPATAGRTVVRHSPDRAGQAATVLAAVPGAVSQEVPGPAGELELVLGDDFTGEVKAPVRTDDAEGAALPTDLSTVNGADSSCR